MALNNVDWRPAERNFVGDWQKWCLKNWKFQNWSRFLKVSLDDRVIKFQNISVEGPLRVEQSHFSNQKKKMITVVKGIKWIWKRKKPIVSGQRLLNTMKKLQFWVLSFVSKLQNFNYHHGRKQKKLVLKKVAFENRELFDSRTLLALLVSDSSDAGKSLNFLSSTSFFFSLPVSQLI